jgi:hypothetical protein
VEETRTSAGPHGQAGHVTADAADRRKPVAVVTHIQETASWDMFQLVLELDTKNAELHILQSLLEQNQSAVHVRRRFSVIFAFLIIEFIVFYFIVICLIFSGIVIFFSVWVPAVCMLVVGDSMYRFNLITRNEQGTKSL